MKRILTLSIILLSMANKINCGSLLSTSSNEETENFAVWKPNATNDIETLLTNIKNEIESYLNTLDYSSVKTHENILDVIESNLNTILKENPEKLPNTSSVFQNQEIYQNNQEFQSNFSEIFKKTVFSIAKQKCLEFKIPITVDEE